MNPNEIKRYIDNMKGEQAFNNSDEEDHTKISGTKTRITLRNGEQVNHDDINFDLEKNLDKTTPLEFDENDLPFSVKTDRMAAQKSHRLDIDH